VLNLPDWELDLFIAHFAAREDVYVVNASGVVRERLTVDVVRRAYDHHYPISTYMADAMGMTHVGALDVDRDDGRQIAAEVQRVLYREGIWSLLVESRRGAHLWIGLAERKGLGLPRNVIKAGLHAVDDDLLRDPKVEVFPKVGTSDLACGALRLPGLPHHKTQQVYEAYTPDGYHSRHVHDMLRTWKPTDIGIATQFADSFRSHSSYPRVAENFYRAWKRDYLGTTPSACEVLAAWGVPNPRPGGTVRCPCHEDAHQSLTIFKDDERVFCGAPHCELNGGGHGVGSVMLGRMNHV